MTIKDNVVKMPDLLERRAVKIEAAMARRAKGNEEWVEGTLELAVELAEAKADHGKDNNKFGEWLDKRFGDNRLPNDERSILVRWGAEPEKWRIELEKAETRSIQLIDRGSRNITRTPQSRKSLRDNKVEAAAEAVKAETGKWPSRKTLSEITGRSSRAADNALRTVKAVEEASGVSPQIQYTKAQDAQIEARIKLRANQLETEFSERVREAAQALYDKNFPTLQNEQNEAHRTEKYYRKMINDHKPPFTEVEFTIILACLHPDNSASKERRETAFRAFNAVKLQLTGKK